MVRWTGFRTAPPCLLSESGKFIGIEATPADPGHAQRIVVSRALCHFEAFPGRVGLAGPALERAARLHAEAHSPFPVGDFALYRQQASVAIWYWDRARVEAALHGRRPYRAADFVPEGALQPAGDGLVLIDLADGQEAQCWRDGSLLASLWRRRRFSAAQWEAFVAGAPGEIGGAADMPLARAGADYRSAHPSGRLSAAPGWRDVERGAWVCAALLLACIAYFAGQTVQFAAMERAERTILEAAASPQEGAARRDASAVSAFASAAPRLDHLLAAMDALEVIGDSGLQVARWNVSSARFEVGIEDVTPDSLASIALQLEDERRLSEVGVRRDGDGVVIVADVFPPGGAQ